MTTNKEQTLSGLRDVACSAVFFGRMFFYRVADDGKWTTTEPHNHVRRHLLCIDRVTSQDGIKAWNIVIGKHMLSWAKLGQQNVKEHLTADHGGSKNKQDAPGG